MLILLLLLLLFFLIIFITSKNDAGFKGFQYPNCLDCLELKTAQKVLEHTARGLIWKIRSPKLNATFYQMKYGAFCKGNKHKRQRTRQRSGFCPQSEKVLWTRLADKIWPVFPFLHVFTQWVSLPRLGTQVPSCTGAAQAPYTVSWSNLVHRFST